MSSFHQDQNNGGNHTNASSTSRPQTAKSSLSSRDSIQASPGSWTSRPFPTTTGSIASLLAVTSHVSASPAPLITSATSLRSISTNSSTNTGTWPATVTYCLQSNGQPVLMFGFVTTGTNGMSTITNTSPSQSIVSATSGSPCLGEIAISSAGNTTIVELSTLPVASTLSQEVTVQTLTLSGTPVVYSPITLSGYNNTEPIEISTSFVETVNGQTTTQWGWWLIGPHGRIDPPVNKPWRTGSGNFGCLGGPLLCNAPCGDLDVGFGWFIHIVSSSCSPGITGPLGWPGGPIIFGSGEPGDDPPPYPESPEDPGNDDPNDCDEDGMECSTTTTTTPTSSSTSPISSTTTMTTKSSVTSQMSSSAASKTPYFLVAAGNAVQTVIEKQLQGYDAEDGASYDPDVEANLVSAGTWVDVNLTAEAAQLLESQSDIELIMTCGYLSLFPPEPTLSTLVGTTVSLTTLSASPSDFFTSIKRRDNMNLQGLSVTSGDVFQDRFHVRNLGEAKGKAASSQSFSSLHDYDPRTREGLQRRDAGTRLVRQLRTDPPYPQDLAMLAWAPGVPTIAGIDYIFEESKGEDTWVYLVDSGVSTGHWVCLEKTSNRCKNANTRLRCTRSFRATGPAQIGLTLTPTGFGPPKCHKQRTIGNVGKPPCPAY